MIDSSLSDFERRFKRQQAGFRSAPAPGDIHQAQAGASIQLADQPWASFEREKVRPNRLDIASNDGTCQCADWAVAERVLQARQAQGTYRALRFRSVNAGGHQQLNGGIDDRDDRVSCQHGARMVQGQAAGRDDKRTALNGPDDFVPPLDRRLVTRQDDGNAAKVARGGW
jgi:hypothetical protein